jgi:hypothetical protein
MDQQQVGNDEAAANQTMRNTLSVRIRAFNDVVRYITILKKNVSNAVSDREF